MSLIIAKIIDGKIQIESDTKISGENVVRNNPINGRLKALVLAHNLTVCYAGDIALAEDAYNWFVEKAKTKIEWQKYLDYLNDLSKTNEVDFILAGYSTEPFILKIKNGVVEQSESTWIGDKNAFSEFQKHFIAKDESENLADKFTNSFGRVVNDQLNQSVGEFHVTLRTNLNDFKYEDQSVPVFQYKLKSKLELGRSKTINIQEKGKAVPVPSGNSTEGDYSISYFTNPNQEWAALGVYFEYGKFGLFFCPGKLLQVKKYDTNDAQEFVNSIFKNTGIELQGMLALEDTFGLKFIAPEK